MIKSHKILSKSISTPHPIYAFFIPLEKGAPYRKKNKKIKKNAKLVVAQLNPHDIKTLSVSWEQLDHLYNLLNISLSKSRSALGTLPFGPNSLLYILKVYINKMDSSSIFPLKNEALEKTPTTLYKINASRDLIHGYSTPRLFFIRQTKVTPEVTFLAHFNSTHDVQGHYHKLSLGLFRLEKNRENKTNRTPIPTSLATLSPVLTPSKRPSNIYAPNKKIESIIELIKNTIRNPTENPLPNLDILIETISTCIESNTLCFDLYLSLIETCLPLPPFKRLCQTSELIHQVHHYFSHNPSCVANRLSSSAIPLNMFLPNTFDKETLSPPESADQNMAIEFLLAVFTHAQTLAEPHLETLHSIAINLDKKQDYPTAIAIGLCDFFSSKILLIPIKSDIYHRIINVLSKIASTIIIEEMTPNQIRLISSTLFRALQNEPEDHKIPSSLYEATWTWFNRVEIPKKYQPQIIFHLNTYLSTHDSYIWEALLLISNLPKNSLYLTEEIAMRLYLESRKNQNWGPISNVFDNQTTPVHSASLILSLLSDYQHIQKTDPGNYATLALLELWINEMIDQFGELDLFGYDECVLAMLKTENFIDRVITELTRGWGVLSLRKDTQQFIIELCHSDLSSHGIDESISELLSIFFHSDFESIRNRIGLIAADDLPEMSEWSLATLNKEIKKIEDMARASADNYTQNIQILKDATAHIKGSPITNLLYIHLSLNYPDIIKTMSKIPKAFAKIKINSKSLTYIIQHLESALLETASGQLNHNHTAYRTIQKYIDILSQEANEELQKMAAKFQKLKLQNYERISKLWASIHTRRDEYDRELYLCNLANCFATSINMGNPFDSKKFFVMIIELDPSYPEKHPSFFKLVYRMDKSDSENIKMVPLCPTTSENA